MEKNLTWLPVVALALADDAGRWMMHCRPDGSVHAGLWEFPGGKVEYGETPSEALIREIGEETGLTLRADSLTPISFAESAAEAQHGEIVLLLYRAQHDGLQNPVALEGGALGWFFPEEVLALAMPPLDRELAQRLFANGAHPNA